jgi:hypothetical protein
MGRPASISASVTAFSALPSSIPRTLVSVCAACALRMRSPIPACLQLPLQSREGGRTTTWRAPGHRRAGPLPSRLFEIADTPVCGLVNAARAHLPTAHSSANTYRGEENGFKGLADKRRNFRRVAVAPRSLAPIVLSGRAETMARPTRMQAVSDTSKALLHSSCTETDKQHGTRWRVDGPGSPLRKGP